MIIRKANPKDIEQYTSLLQQTYQATYVDTAIGLTTDCFSKEVFNSDDTQQYLKAHLVNTATQKTWLAFDEGKLIGSATCILMDGNEGELTGFYVHPKEQGQGIGRKLYNLVLEFAGGRDLLLDVYVHNVRAIELYKKWGWQIEVNRGDNGYFYRHWKEWPAGLQAKCVYMRLKRKVQ
jgi:ribosomal protein S18 acetylase RimI-like enzyme